MPNRENGTREDLLDTRILDEASKMYPQQSRSIRLKSTRWEDEDEGHVVSSLRTN